LEIKLKAIKIEKIFSFFEKKKKNITKNNLNLFKRINSPDLECDNSSNTK